jgi:Bacterial Ig domain/FG-GAP-like repeat
VNIAGMKSKRTQLGVLVVFTLFGISCHSTEEVIGQRCDSVRLCEPRLVCTDGTCQVPPSISDSMPNSTDAGDAFGEPLPFVEILRPKNDEYVGEDVTISTRASMDVTRVSFTVDGTMSLGTITAIPFEVSWMTSMVPEGPHSVDVEAIGRQGVYAHARVNVFVDRTPPEVQFVKPTRDAEFVAGLEIDVSISDAVSVVDNSTTILTLDEIVLADLGSTRQQTWDTSKFVPGEYIVRAVATDGAGHRTVADVRVRKAAPLGSPCAQGSECGSKNCVKNVCCESACDGLCESCSQVVSVGRCLPIQSGGDGRECVGDMTCSAGECKRVDGKACGVDSDVCASGNCADGFCCSGSCTGVCYGCAVEGGEGACQPLAQGEEDGANCSGSQACDGNGKCKGKIEGACRVSADCLSGYCVAGKCCRDAKCSPIWPGSSIPVCWATPGFVNEKKWIRRAIEDTWGAETGLVFEKWFPCGPSFWGDIDYGLRIELSSEWPRTASVGVLNNNILPGVVLNPNPAELSLSSNGTTSTPFANCVGVNREKCVRNQAVHLFGHAIGFPMHPIGSSDVPDGSELCVQLASGPLTPSSIMAPEAYCASPVGMPVLSVSDVDFGRRHYGYQNAPEHQFITGDVNGDGTDEILQAWQDWWAIPECRFQSDSFSLTCEVKTAQMYSYDVSDERVFPGDFDGDSRLDLVQGLPAFSTYPVCASTGDKWSCTDRAAVLYDNDDYSSNEQVFLVGDYDGDGRSDIAQNYRKFTSIPTCLSRGAGWLCVNETEFFPDEGSPEQQALVGDVNGDGRDDIVHTSRRWPYSSVCLASGAGSWTCSDWALPLNDHDTPEQRFHLADFNGDGLADLATTYRGAKSIPVCFSRNTRWECTKETASITDSGSFEQTFVLGDFDDDGRSDFAIAYRMWQHIEMCLSDGKGAFKCSKLAATLEDSGSNLQKFSVADLNGDGKSDLISTYIDWDFYVICLSSGSALDCRKVPAGIFNRDEDPAKVRVGQHVAGRPQAYIKTDGTDAIVVRSDDQHLLEISNGLAQDITERSFAPTRIASEPWGFARSDDFNSIIYRGTDNHVYEIFSAWFSPRIHYGDLTFYATGTDAIGNPTGYVKGDGTNAMVHRGIDNHLHEIELFEGRYWRSNDLTLGSGFRSTLAGDPVAYVPPAGIAAVVFRATDGHIHEIRLENSVWVDSNISIASGELVSAVADPSVFVRSDGKISVLYVANDGQLHALTSSDGRDWNREILPASNPVGTPSGYTRWDGKSSIVYRSGSTDSTIHELVFGDRWIDSSLDLLSNAPVRAGGDPFGSRRSDSRGSVAYLGIDGSICEQTSNMVGGWTFSSY